MGTETLLSFLYTVDLSIPVKLNNPQMGTETRDTFDNLSAEERRSVKLNNPQMGTETPKYQSLHRYLFSISLN